MREVGLAVVLGVAFLHVFYRAIASQWPSAYFGGSVATYAVTTTPVHYLAFRFLPVFATCLFVAVTMERIGASAAIAVSGLLVGHAALTTLRGVWSQTFGGGRPIRSAPLLILHLAVAVGFSLVGLLAFYTKSSLAGLVPAVQDVTASLWTAALAGIIGAYAVKASQTTVDEPAKLLRQSERRIPNDLWQYAGLASQASNVDPHLTRAIMIVENLARPAWFRRLERAKGSLVGPGTYGIMQAYSGSAISDRESIDLVVKTRLQNLPPFVSGDGYPDYGRLRQFAKSYNDDGDYADMVVQAYADLRSRT